MHSKEYLGQTYAQVTIAPWRRGLLVSPDNVEQLKMAFQGASTIWGGARCPVLPIAEDGRIAPGFLQIADSLNVRELIDFSDGAFDEEWIANERARWSYSHAKPLSDARYWAPHPLLVSLDDDVQGLEIVLPAEMNLQNLARGGGLVDADEVQWWRDCGANVQENADDDLILRAQLGNRTILAATANRDTDVRVGGGLAKSHAFIWVIRDSLSFVEAVWFWNFRALRPWSFDAGTSLIASVDQLSNNEILSDIRNVIASQSTTTPDVTFFGNSFEGSDLVDFARSLELAQDESGRMTDLIAGRRDRSSEITFTARTDLRQLWCQNRLTGVQSDVSVQRQRPAASMRFKSPITWRSNLIGTGPLTLEVSLPELTGPKRDSVARLYQANSHWSGQALALRTEPRSIYDIPVSWPGDAEILEAACADLGATYALSDKGQQLSGVLQGGFDHSLFRRREFVAIVKSLTPATGRDLAKELASAREAGALSESAEEMLLASANIGRLESRTLNEVISASPFVDLGCERPKIGMVLEEMIRRQLVVRGWRIDCSLCSLKEFEEIGGTGRAGANPTCKGCGAIADFRSSHTGEPELYYRLNTLMQRVSVNGGLAPLAAYSLLKEEGGFILPGVDVVIDGSSQGDLDILGWNASDLFAGEAKMSAGGFLKQDNEKDILKSISIGANVHIIICMESLADEFHEEIRAKCEAKGITLRVLDRDVLLA